MNVGVSLSDANNALSYCMSHICNSQSDIVFVVISIILSYDVGYKEL
jgi:hypothetical protein